MLNIIRRDARFHLWLLFTITVISGCSSGSDKQTVEATTESQQFWVTPNQTTQIVDSQQRTILTIEPDTFEHAVNIDLNIENQQNTAGLQSFVYTFSGNTSEFKQLAELTIPLPLIDIPDNHSLRIVRKHGDHWFALPGTQITAQVAKARVHSLGSYALALEENKVAHAHFGSTCPTDSASQPEKSSINFVHVSDLHSLYGQSKNNAYAKIKAYANTIKEQNPDTLFTNSGDDFEKGHVIESLTSGHATVAVTQAMQFDIRTIGNHDVAWGAERMFEFAQDAHGIVVSSNFIYQANDFNDFAAHQYAQVQLGCVKMGVIALTGRAWNEIDKEYFGPYTDNVNIDLWYNQVAENYVNLHRDEVDIMLLVSHLGWGTDRALASEVDGIDLILGGHSHAGVQVESNLNDTFILQPDFFAKGVSLVEIEYDHTQNAITNITHQSTDIESLIEIDPDVKTVVAELESEHQNRIGVNIAESQNTLRNNTIAELISNAGRHVHQADASLIDPSLLGSETLFAGRIDLQSLYSLYYPERQKPNTPSFNAFYTATISGAHLSSIQQSNPHWVIQLPQALNPEGNYKVLLQKGAAQNPQLKLGEQITLSDVTFAGEVYQALESYAHFKQQQCLFVDSNLTNRQCQTNIISTIWQFEHPDTPLHASQGSAVLSYFDPNQSNWYTDNITFNDAASFSIPPYPDSPADKRIMSVATLTSSQGLTLTHHAKPNGRFEDQELVSEWTLILDILSPNESTNQWRALLQTDITNQSDADWFIENSAAGGTGISQYFGSTQANQWHRIAFVSFSNDDNGIAKVYIDGELAGILENIDQRWALGPQALLFTDNNAETAKLFIGKIEFIGKALSQSEIEEIGSF